MKYLKFIILGTIILLATGGIEHGEPHLYDGAAPHVHQNGIVHVH